MCVFVFTPVGCKNETICKTVYMCPCREAVRNKEGDAAWIVNRQGWRVTSGLFWANTPMNWLGLGWQPWCRRPEPRCSARAVTCGGARQQLIGQTPLYTYTLFNIFLGRITLGWVMTCPSVQGFWDHVKKGNNTHFGYTLFPPKNYVSKGSL